MRILTKMLRQKAVYWEPLGLDENSEQTFADDPYEIKVRWEDRQEEYRDKYGTIKISRSVVYVGEDLLHDGILKLGTLADLDSLDPRQNKEAFPILGKDKIPTLKGTKFLRIAYL